MTAWMRARVSSCTSGDWLMTRDTVFFDTPASRAMSLMVALRPGLIVAGLGCSAGFGAARATMFFLRFMGRGLYETCRRRGRNVLRCPPRYVPKGRCLCNRCHRDCDTAQCAEPAEHRFGRLAGVDRVDPGNRAGGHQGA